MHLGNIYYSRPKAASPDDGAGPEPRRGPRGGPGRPARMAPRGGCVLGGAMPRSRPSGDLSAACAGCGAGKGRWDPVFQPLGPGRMANPPPKKIAPRRGLGPGPPPGGGLPVSWRLWHELLIDNPTRKRSERESQAPQLRIKAARAIASRKPLLQPPEGRDPGRWLRARTTPAARVGPAEASSTRACACAAAAAEAAVV